MSTTNRTAALSAYRYVLRATRVAFNSDPVALNGSRSQIRAGFKADRNVTDEAEIKEKIQYIKDIGLILRTNVVQAQKKSEDDNNFGEF
ncbi:Mzm1p [Sugiyamaella lignohabitans]|uniref:Mitochondrial zinc maintenance protein 1, mitochondrial n=1 Tax=Sugiyamaella lignohabitans TaxID=796027 RepID=A0A161HFN3_9ASCO|nr:Mzm1p [Sugiyamaella lignohabitans]ANB14390.1 Mzm1p [Sugiyamaella lignohabitans]